MLGWWSWRSHHQAITPVRLKDYHPLTGPPWPAAKRLERRRWCLAPRGERGIGRMGLSGPRLPCQQCLAVSASLSVWAVLSAVLTALLVVQCWVKVTLSLPVTHQSYAREIAHCRAHHPIRRAADDAPRFLVGSGFLTFGLWSDSTGPHVVMAILCCKPRGTL